MRACAIATLSGRLLPAAAAGAWRRAAAAAALAGAAATTAALAAPPAAKSLTPSEVFARVAPSVWRVQTLDADGLLQSQGSAVVIAPGRLVTNCHVLAKARRVQVRRDGAAPPLLARLELWDVQRDLCQLDAPGVNSAPVRLADSALPAVGEPAFAVGHPKGLDLTVSAGLVSSLRRNSAGQLLLIQTSAAISGGNSGGGLFNDRAELLGLTTLVSVAPDAQNLNFALPANWIRELPRRHAAAQAGAASGTR